MAFSKKKTTDEPKAAEVVADKEVDVTGAAAVHEVAAAAATKDKKAQAAQAKADNEAVVAAAVEREKAGPGPEIGSPEWRRADNVRALEEELDMCERDGKTERVAAIKDAIKAAKSQPVGRKAPESDEA